MSGTAGGHYSIGAVSKSLRHFLVGKTFTMISSLVVLFLLARVLEPEAYAVYIALQGLVVLIGRVGSIGVEKVMHRYLPELRATGDYAAAYRLLWQGTLLRLATVGAMLLAAGLALPAIGGAFGLNDWLWLVPWYLVVGLLRLLNLWVGAMLESFLWQKESQYSFAAGGLAKLAAVVVAAGALELPLLVAIELASEALILGLLGIGWLLRWRADPTRSQGTTRWWRDNRGRALRYGFWGFLQTQSRLLYGSAPNRLLVAHYLPVAEVALFGMADNVINLVRRFMPAHLFIGLIRPVAIARFAASKDFTQVAWMSNLAYRLNLLVLVLGMAVLVTVGEPVFALLTDDKYPAAAWIVAGLLVLMATEGMRTLVELMAQAVERNNVFFWSNLIQSASLLIAIPLIPILGLWGVIVANIAGTITANLLVIVRLRRAGYAFRLNLLPVGLILSYGLVSALLGWWLTSQIGLHFLLVGILVTVAYAMLCVVRPPFEADEREVLMKLLRRRAGKKRLGRGAVSEVSK